MTARPPSHSTGSTMRSVRWTHIVLFTPVFLLVAVVIYHRIVFPSSSSSSLFAGLPSSLPYLFQAYTPHQFVPLTACSPRHMVQAARSNGSSITLYVSPRSLAARQTGTSSSPFTSIEQALEALAEQRLRRPDVAVTVELDSGSYYRPTPLLLNASHSGSEVAPVVITSRDPASPASLTGGKEIPSSCFQALSAIPRSALSRIPASSHPHVLSIHLPSCLSLQLPLPRLLSFGFSQPVLPSHPLLYLDSTPLTLARYPNIGEDWLRTGRVTELGSVIRSGNFTKQPFTFLMTPQVQSRVERWRGRGGAGVQETDSVMMLGYWRWDWAEQAVQVKRIHHGAVTSRQPSHYGVVENARYFLYNVLEELDVPGEYYIDSDGWMYVFPPHRYVTEEMRTEGRKQEAELGLSSSSSLSSLSASQLVLALSPHPVVTFSSAHHIQLRQLTVELTRGSGIRILSSHHLSLSHLTIRRIGNVGVMCGQGAPVQQLYTADPEAAEGWQDEDVVVGDMGQAVYHKNFIDSLWNRQCGSCIVVSQCHLHTLGAGGVIMGGGDRVTLTPGHNGVVNNHIHTFSMLWHTYRAAVWLDGVGNEVSHNVISGGPHVAVLLNGNDHRVEYNDISAVCEETADVGVIYIGRDWTQRGHLVRYNFIHHISALVPVASALSSLDDGNATWLSVGRDASAVYFDDLSSGSTVSHNVFYRVHRAVLIGGGSAHTVTHNLFLQVETPIWIDARAMTSHKVLVAADDSLIQRYAATPVASAHWRAHYPGLDELLEHHPEQPSGNVVQHNAMVACGPMMLSTQVLDRPSNNWEGARELTDSTTPAPGTEVVRVRVDGVNISFVHSGDVVVTSVQDRLYRQRVVLSAEGAADGGAGSREGHRHICYDICVQHSWMLAQDLWIDYDLLKSLSGWRLDPLPTDSIGPCCMDDQPPHLRADAALQHQHHL